MMNITTHASHASHVPFRPRQDSLRGYSRAIVAVDRETDVGRLLAAVRLAAPRVPISYVHAFDGDEESVARLDLDEFTQHMFALSLQREAAATVRRRIAEGGGDPTTLVLRRGKARRVLLREIERHRGRRALFVLGRSHRHPFFSVTRAVTSRTDALVA